MTNLHEIKNKCLFHLMFHGRRLSNTYTYSLTYGHAYWQILVVTIFNVHLLTNLYLQILVVTIFNVHLLTNLYLQILVVTIFNT